MAFDHPAVAADPREPIEAAGPTGRCEVTDGDFFVAVQDGSDIYLPKHILHDWDDERSVAILRACRRATPQNERLLVIEKLLPRGNALSFAKMGTCQST